MPAAASARATEAQERRSRLLWWKSRTPGPGRPAVNQVAFRTVPSEAVSETTRAGGGEAREAPPAPSAAAAWRNDEARRIRTKRRMARSGHRHEAAGRVGDGLEHSEEQHAPEGKGEREIHRQLHPRRPLADQHREPIGQEGRRGGLEEPGAF